MKKMTAGLIVAMSLTGCASASAATFEGSGRIEVITREDGSGTRSAFMDLFGIEDIMDDAVVTNSTSVMMMSVKQDKYAIGYTSLGSLSDEVKAVYIDGVEPSEETVADGTYPIKRPFILVSKENGSELQEDFLTFINSEEGHAVISDKGYIPADETDTWTASGISGSLTIGGSSSVTPLMEKLAEKYMEENPDCKIMVMQSESSTGINGAADGTYDIGMSSREIKDSEKDLGLKETVIALDGIAVIVNTENPIENLTSEQVKEIYTGEVTTWNDAQQN